LYQGEKGSGMSLYTRTADYAEWIRKSYAALTAQ
jgi:hypothetical protein